MYIHGSTKTAPSKGIFDGFWGGDKGGDMWISIFAYLQAWRYSVGMKRRRIVRRHFAPLPIEAVMPMLIPDRRLGYITQAGELIAKVYGAAPAIVFAPPGPIASIIRPLKVPSAKQRAAWARWSARINDGGDYIPGLDDGECERQRRVY